MRELDKQYPIHREEFLKRLRKQDMLAERGLDEDDNKGKRRGRKATKPSKNIEVEPNTNTYASSSSSKYNWFK